LSTLSPENLKIFYTFNKSRSEVKAVVGSIITNILLITFRPKYDNTNLLGTKIVGIRYKGRKTVDIKIKE
jgi:hypothetical protein